jgi:hypothetical protein
MADREQIHAAMYPGSLGGDLFSEQTEVNIRQHALESACFCRQRHRLAGRPNEPRPPTAKTVLLYDLIGPREQRGGHIVPEGLRGLQVGSASNATGVILMGKTARDMFRI